MDTFPSLKLIWKTACSDITRECGCHLFWFRLDTFCNTEGSVCRVHLVHGICNWFIIWLVENDESGELNQILSWFQIIAEGKFLKLVLFVKNMVFQFEMWWIVFLILQLQQDCQSISRRAWWRRFWNVAKVDICIELIRIKAISCMKNLSRSDVLDGSVLKSCARSIFPSKFCINWVFVVDKICKRHHESVRTTQLSTSTHANSVDILSERVVFKFLNLFL